MPVYRRLTKTQLEALYKVYFNYPRIHGCREVQDKTLLTLVDRLLISYEECNCIREVRGRDGCTRDLTKTHRTYNVPETKQDVVREILQRAGYL